MLIILIARVVNIAILTIANTVFSIAITFWKYVLVLVLPILFLVLANLISTNTNTNSVLEHTITQHRTVESVVQFIIARTVGWNHGKTRYEVKCPMKEVDSYLADTADNLESLNAYKHVRQLYISLNTGLPSSAAVERLFCPIRSRLSSGHFEMMTFLRLAKW